MKSNLIQIVPAPAQRRLWPDYAATQVICFSNWKDGVAYGELYSFYFERAFPFVGLDGLLFTMEEVMDQAGYPAAWDKMRELTPKNQPCRSTKEERVHTQPSVLGQPFYPPDGLRGKHGQLCTVAVRVYCRQYASMQGEARFPYGTIYFRSALELLHLLSEALEITSLRKRDD